LPPLVVPTLPSPRHCFDTTPSPNPTPRILVMDFYAPRCAPGQTEAGVNVSTPDNLARLRTGCERPAKDFSNTF